MSHSFYVNGIKNLSIKNVCEKSGFNDLHFLPGYAQPENGNWPSGVAYVFRDAVSVRALETEIDGTTLKVRIFAASSPDDYKLGIKLTKAIAELAGASVEPEDNDSMSVDEFCKTYNDTWITEHCKSMLSVVLGRHIKEPNSVSHLSGVRAEMKIGPTLMAELKQDKAGMAQGFFNRFKRLNYIDQEDVYQATLMVLENKGDGKKVRVATYTESVPTLLIDKNTVVTFAADPFKGKGEDGDQIFVLAKQLKELIGDEAIWLSDNVLLLPELSGEAWKNLTMRARDIAASDLMDHGFLPGQDPYEQERQSETPAQGVSEKDLGVLSYAPMLVFFIVASADGSIDKKEFSAFQLELLKGVLTDSELLPKVLVLTVANFQDIAEAFMKQEMDVIPMLTDIISILATRVDAEESLKFRKSLLAMGQKIAEASGGLFGFFGSKVSKEEKQALAKLEKILGLS